MSTLEAKQIIKLFKALNLKLKEKDVQGELYLVGGAVMCLVFNARVSTQDVDALFKPSKYIRDAARDIAVENNISTDWLNDGVKGFFSEKGNFNLFLELSNLQILSATAEYLLAMKCLAMRLGAEFHDLNDIRYLLRHLNISSYKKALEVICEYYPLEKFPQKTLYALEELLENSL